MWLCAIVNGRSAGKPFPCLFYFLGTHWFVYFQPRQLYFITVDALYWREWLNKRGKHDGDEWISAGGSTQHHFRERGKNLGCWRGKKKHFHILLVWPPHFKSLWLSLQCPLYTAAHVFSLANCILNSLHVHAAVTSCCLFKYRSDNSIKQQ